MHQENEEQVNANDLQSKNNYSTPITALHKFSSTGDVAALQSLFESHPSLDVNAASRKSRNTALHYAVSQNQQGFIIDYLLSRGADPNRPNAYGYTPMMLAIVNCNTSEALQKLLDAGAYTQLLKKEDRHAVFELAIQRNKREAEQVLLRYIPSANDETQKHAHNNTNSVNVLSKVRGKAICPLCHSTVKFPSRMSFLPLDQKLSEDAANNSNLEKDKKQLHEAHKSSPQQPFDDEKKNKGKETRVYLDLFLSSVAFTEMCKVEYHG
jgi:ankyrin repeat protein